MAEIRWDLLQPVDVGASVMQGFQTGMGLVKHVQTQGALKNYLANPADTGAYNALAAYDPDAARQIQAAEIGRRRLIQEQQDRERQVALGGLYTRDPAGAREEAIASGDFDLAKTFSEMDTSKQKQAGDFWGKAGPIAFQLKQTADPQQRMALWQQAKPMLAATGAPAQLLDSFDPTNDTQLDAAIATSQKVSDLIEQSRVTWHQQGEQPSFATDYMGRPVGSANPYRQGAPAAAAEPPHAAASAVSSTLSSGGIPAPVVAGFMGNFHIEGGYTGAQGDGGRSGGLAQWNGERRDNFRRVIGKDPTEAGPEESARFVLWEMQNPEAAGMTVDQRDAILAAKTAPEAADLIDRFYERSSGEHRQRRIAAASRYGQPARVSSKAEFDALPKGAEFIAPDGSHRRKS